jgi:hypothetical protein
MNVVDFSAWLEYFPDGPNASYVYWLRSVPQFGRAGPASANTGPVNTLQIMIIRAKPAAIGVLSIGARVYLRANS